MRILLPLLTWLGVAAAISSLTPSPAVAQRVSLTDLDQRLAALQARLNDLEKKPLADADASTQPTLTIYEAAATFAGYAPSTVQITGQGFGSRAGS